MVAPLSLDAGLRRTVSWYLQRSTELEPHESAEIHLIARPRPNFMKIAPLYHALSGERWCRAMIVHTGQHYDYNMSASFFRDLKLPEPDFHLEVGSGSHAEQTAA